MIQVPRLTMTAHRRRPGRRGPDGAVVPIRTGALGRLLGGGMIVVLALLTASCTSPATVPPENPSANQTAIPSEIPGGSPTAQQGLQGEAALERQVLDALSFEPHDKTVAWHIASNTVSVTVYTDGDEMDDDLVTDMLARAEAVTGGIPVVVAIADQTIA